MNERTVISANNNSTTVHSLFILQVEETLSQCQLVNTKQQLISDSILALVL